MVEQLYSVIAVSHNGTVSFSCKTNEKGYKKSLENKQLWYIHEETEKLIPYDIDLPLESLHKVGETIVALYTSTETKTETYDISQQETVLERLETTIQERNATRPTGSYTTHLFESGEDKIRKKLGEEAVEVLLAKTHEDIVYESADLIYHLLVLLVDKNISLRKVLEELSKRM